MASSKISNPMIRQPLPMNSNNQMGLNSSSHLSMMSGQQSPESFQISQFNGLNPYQMSMQFPAYTATFPNMSMGQVPLYNQSYPPPPNNYQF